MDSLGTMAPGGNEDKRKDNPSLDDMIEQDIAVALIFATHRHLQPEYTIVAALSQLGRRTVTLSGSKKDNQR